jgi:hypothetical protein
MTKRIKSKIPLVNPYSKDQLNAFGRLWFVFGNNGDMHTDSNHIVMKGFYKHGVDTRGFYVDRKRDMLDDEGEAAAIKKGISDRCYDTCQLVLDGDIKEALESVGLVYHLKK